MKVSTEMQKNRGLTSTAIEIKFTKFINAHDIYNEIQLVLFNNITRKGIIRQNRQTAIT